MRAAFESSGRGYLGFATRQAAPPVEKMRVLQNVDGSITITPSGEDNVLQVTGDPDAGQVVVTENQALPNVPAVADLLTSRGHVGQGSRAVTEGCTSGPRLANPEVRTRGSLKAGAPEARLLAWLTCMLQKRSPSS